MQTHSSSSRDASCWTCRLRHKRCDAAAPVCGPCNALSIQCHYSNVRPPWMDHGPRQHEASQRLSDEIRQNARHRRIHRRAMRLLASMGSTVDLSAPPPPTSAHSDSSLWSRSEIDIGSAMSYMDIVFPTLYPCYLPQIFDGGRGWLLVLLLRSNAFLSTILSLVAYFYYCVPVGPEPGRLVCTEITWETLQNQMQNCMLALQSDLREMGPEGSPEYLLQNAQAFCSIMHLIKLETLIGSSESWTVHLDASVNQFRLMLAKYDSNEYVSPLAAIQREMWDLPGAPTPSNTMASFSNACQTSFRFSAAMVLFSDIISSTVLGCSPRLRRYHADLLGDGNGQPSSDTILLEDYFGCQNWVLLQIGAVSALAAWKKDMVDSGLLDVSQLLERGRALETALHQGLDRLDAQLPASSESLRDAAMHGIAPGFDLFASRKMITRIWAYTAGTYLATIVHGCDSTNPNIRVSMRDTISLFQQIQSAVWMGTLVWPFCINACLAREEDRPVFRALGASFGALKNLGVIRDAVAIAEKVWTTADEGNLDSWDVKACLSCLGHRALLI